MIVKKKDGYYVKSKGGKALGGPYGSRLAALRRLKQVEWYAMNKENKTIVSAIVFFLL